MRAYPYLEMQGGIDRHGNFLNVQNMRVAISPYLQYGSLTELVMEVESRTGLGTQDGFNDLVRESKMDFHLLLEG
ncbi:MAG: hypothetical protein AAF623_15635, partial [Planctomycetota bacterium]